MKIKNIKQKIKNYNFLCIGACHKDIIISLKNDIKYFRTNPVESKFELGGVASNISHNLSLFSNKVKIFSLKIINNHKKVLKKNKIKFYNISKNNNDSFYIAVINKFGKLIAGLASNQDYEKINSINYNIINRNIKKNTFIILDLCFNKKLTSKIIKYYYKKRIEIMVSGTSSFKINRIKESLNMISGLCLNEDEIYMLTKKKKLKESINFILNKNKKISLAVTRGNKSVLMVYNEIFYEGIVPKIKVVNENGAGDAFTSMFFLSLCAKINPILTLKLSIALGCMQVIEYKNKNLLKYDKKFQHFIDKIKIKKYDSKIHRN